MQLGIYPLALLLSLLLPGQPAGAAPRSALGLEGRGCSAVLEGRIGTAFSLPWVGLPGRRVAVGGGRAREDVRGCPLRGIESLGHGTGLLGRSLRERCRPLELRKKAQGVLGRPEGDAGLPAPTPEQQAVLDAARLGYCVSVQSVAGAGKTTLLLQLVRHLPPDRKAVLLTYNRLLKDDCAQKIERLGLSSRVNVSTMHGLVAKCADRSCKDDQELLEVMDLWAKTPPKLPPDLSDVDTFMIDEVQDMRPSLYKAVCTILEEASAKQPNGLQMVLVGDPNQLLYDYVKGDAADAAYLTQAQAYFGRFAEKRIWKKLALSVSHRMSPNIVEFANTIFGTAIESGNVLCDEPVDYLCAFPYPSQNESPVLKNDTGVKTTLENSNRLNLTFFADVIDKYGPEKVIFLAQSVATQGSPIMKIVNGLSGMERPDGTRRFNFYVQSRDFKGSGDSLENKVRVLSFAGSKGCEGDVVVVFGFEMWSLVRVCSKNQLFVASTRARNHLIVVHGGTWDGTVKNHTAMGFCANSYYPLLGGDEGNLTALMMRSNQTRKQLQELQNRCVIRTFDGSDLPVRTVLGDIEIKPKWLEATAKVFLSPNATNKLLGFGSWTQVTEPGDPIRFDVEVRFNETTEGVSVQYGQALTLMLQAKHLGYCPEIEAMLRTVSVGEFRKYKKETVLAMLKPYEIGPVDMQVLNDAFSDGPIFGKDLVDLVNRRISVRERISVHGVGERDVSLKMTLDDKDRSRQSNPSIDDREGLDLTLSEKIDRLHDVHNKTDRTPADFVFMANYLLANGGFHEKFAQCDRPFEEWVCAEALEEALVWVLAVVPSPSVCFGRFEHGLRYDFDGEKVAGVVGVVDWSAGGFWKGDDIIEIKFVQELRTEYLLQALLYAAMLAIKQERRGSTLLYNAKTGEGKRINIAYEDAEAFLSMYCDLVGG